MTLRKVGGILAAGFRGFVTQSSNMTPVTLRRCFTLCLYFGGIVVFPNAGRADTINLGFISFDGFIPGSSTSPGVNEFSINNFTGDPKLGGFALAPDFPTFTFLTFQNAELTLNETSGQEVFHLGDLSAGTSLSDLITASVDLRSATFSATLDQTALVLPDGTTFMASSVAIEATVFPSSPPSLDSGDFAIITVSSVPEPASGYLLLVAAVPVVWRRTRHRM